MTKNMNVFSWCDGSGVEKYEQDTFGKYPVHVTVARNPLDRAGGN